MKKNIVTTLVTTTLASGLLVFSAVSSAAPVVGFFDFTDTGVWGALDGKMTETVNGLTFTAVGGSITVNEDFSGTDPSSAYLPCSGTNPYVCTGDGLGVGNGTNSRQDDELSFVSSSEHLTISGFGGATITMISFLDTFIEGHTEVASFYINNNLNDFTDVFASAEGGNGFTEWVGTLTDVNSITFFVNCGAFDGSNCAWDNDFSVAAINAVPVPAAVWLFGSGLIGLVAIARRRKET